MNEFLKKFRTQYPQYDDVPDVELARLLHGKFYADMSFEEFAGQIGLLENTGPTKQPPFPNLPPMVGGALDALVAFGGGTGIPQLLSSRSRDYMAELRERSPGGTMAAQGAGALAAGGAGLLATPARLPTAATALSHLAGRGGLTILNPATQSLGARGAALAGRLPWGKLGIGGGGLYALNELRKIFGSNR